MKNKKILLLFLLLIITGCVGTSSTGVFGTGVTIALDPRTVGTQIDDSIMQKNLSAKLINMNNPLTKLYQWQINSGQLDGWTSYHLAAGLFIAKVAQWLGASDLWAVLWVLIIGILWEIFEVWVEGTHETYGTKKKWAYNTAADIIVEVGAAAWMVW